MSTVFYIAKNSTKSIYIYIYIFLYIWTINYSYSYSYSIYICLTINLIMTVAKYSKSVFLLSPKIPGTMDCELYRTTSLMSHLTKVLLRIIMARIRKSKTRDITTAIWFHKSTRNAIYLSMLAERYMQKDLYLCFIDYSKAFDKVRHEKL